jgi:hypothetical protein
MIRILCSTLLLLFFQQTLFSQYGHNWTWKAAPDAAKLRTCVSEMGKILNASPVPLAGIDSKGKPMVRDGVISFNQKEDEAKSGDPFVFPGNVGRNTCKTNQAPYDVTVMACLIVAMEHFNKDECLFGSDGKMTEAGEWKEGIALYRKVFGRDPKFISADKVASALDIVKHIDLKPRWGATELWIVIGLLALGALAAWYVFNPRPDFSLHLESGGDAYVKGKFPEQYLNAVRSYFQSEMPINRNVVVQGWNEPDGRFRLWFHGPLSDKEQQQIRSFFGMLRAKKPETTSNSSTSA